MEIPQKSKYRTTVGASNPPLEHISGQNYNSKRYMHPCFHSNTTQDSRDGSSRCGRAETNPTGIHEDGGLMPGLAQWAGHPVFESYQKGLDKQVWGQISRSRHCSYSQKVRGRCGRCYPPSLCSSPLHADDWTPECRLLLQTQLSSLAFHYTLGQKDSLQLTSPSITSESTSDGQIPSCTRNLGYKGV